VEPARPGDDGGLVALRWGHWLVACPRAAKGVYRGQGERETLWNEFWSTFEEVEAELSDFRHTGPYVVASNTAHMRGRDGIEVTARSTFVYTVENGQITRIRMFQERAEALEAAGLSE
jgi:ketosteroid isomerase-like protein